MWGKEGLGNIGQKRNKKKRNKKNISLLACPRWRRRDLRGLRGDARWRGGGLRTRHVGKRGLGNTGQKRNEKKKTKNLSLLACPRMQAIAVAGVGTKGKGQQRHGGLCARRWGCGRPSCVGCRRGPRAVGAV